MTNTKTPTPATAAQPSDPSLKGKIEKAHLAAAAQETAASPTVPKGYWEAADGSLVPESKVKNLDKARDEVVRRLVAAAQELSVQMESFRRLSLTEIETFVEMSAATYGVTVRGAAGKGNVTLTSFDGAKPLKS